MRTGTWRLTGWWEEDAKTGGGERGTMNSWQRRYLKGRVESGNGGPRSWNYHVFGPLCFRLISLINVNAKLAKKCNTNIGPHVCFFEGLPNFWWKTKKLPTRCLQSHISPKHRLNKEHLDETFPFYRAGRLFFEMIHFCYIIWACLHHWNDIVWSGLLLWYK